MFARIVSASRPSDLVLAKEESEGRELDEYDADELTEIF